MALNSSSSFVEFDFFFDFDDLIFLDLNADGWGDEISFPSR